MVKLTKGGLRKILVVCLVVTLALVLLASSRGVSGPISIYVRNVGCEARDVQVVLDGKAVGDIVEIGNDGVWIDLGEHDFEEMLDLRILMLNGKILQERGFGTAYFNDWKDRQVLAVTILQDHVIHLMKHKPPHNQTP